ncbi:hypothetical protein NQZ68_022007 [Dissostichus eleginoides]|nr:hypothetical protein NQZ68_022007 [Dissostichus eleginoides]
MAERSKAPDSRTGSFLSKGTSGLHMEAMAERSKAPDSRTGSFLSKGTSGLHMEAWVQIPLLTECFTWALAPR